MHSKYLYTERKTNKKLYKTCSLENYYKYERRKIIYQEMKALLCCKYYFNLEKKNNIKIMQFGKKKIKKI